MEELFSRSIMTLSTEINVILAEKVFLLLCSLSVRVSSKLDRPNPKSENDIFQTKNSHQSLLNVDK